jgi:hypothetical protein
MNRLLRSLPALLVAQLLTLLCGCSTLPPHPSYVPASYRLLYAQDFERPDSLHSFTSSDPAAWSLTRHKGNTALELTRQSRYQPAVRSPVNIALLGDRVFGDFLLEADLLQTSGEYGHRDMCLFFNFRNPTNFYYAHIATSADANAHNIFRVQNAPRTNIASQTTKGIDWGRDVWHHVRIHRQTATGSITVFFDDMTQPLMIAQDRAFDWGWIGFGSFDDTGKVDNIRIWGPDARRLQAPPFP